MPWNRPYGRLALLVLSMPACAAPGLAPTVLDTAGGSGSLVTGATGLTETGRPLHLLAGEERRATAAPLPTSPDWTATGGGSNRALGSGVGSAGDVNGDGWEDVYVAAEYWTDGQTLEGRVAVYLGSATGLGASPAWAVEPNQAGYLFGADVAAGDVNGDGYGDLLVGVPYYGNGSLREGRAQLYLGSASGLGASASWSYEPNAANQNLGAAVAITDVNGDGYGDVAVGASGVSNGQANEGRVLVFLGSGSGPPASASWSFESNVASARLGAALRPAGDVNGDGYGDLAVGAWSWTGTATSQGRVYVFHGSATGLPASASWTAQGSAASDQFGINATGVGDVDGDGYADLLVGANGAWSAEGEVYLYRGSSSGLGATPGWTWRTGLASSALGTDIAPAADVNGDGYADIAVGAYNADGSSGRAYVFWGGPSGPGSTPGWEGSGSGAADWYGAAVGVADPDGDGFGDLLVGAPQATTSQGLVSLYRGGAASAAADMPDYSLGGGSLTGLGTSVAMAGDVNGDGYDDAVVGAPDASGLGVVVYLPGGSTGITGEGLAVRVGTSALGGFGFDVDGAGDVDGDGYTDVLVGAPWAGEARLYRGGAGGLDLLPAWSGVGSGADEYGRVVAGVGDVNGDGYGDIVVTAPSDSTDAASGGAAWLHLGGPSGPSAAADWEVHGGDVAGALGSAATGAGDVNGDGYADLLLADEASVGRAHLLLGAPSGPATTPDWTVSHPEGYRIAPRLGSGGDLDGDGFDDVVVTWPDTAFGEAWVTVYLGGPDGPPSNPDVSFVISSAEPIAELVPSCGDVDGDGDADLVLGFPGSSVDGPSRGRIEVYHGGPGGPATTPEWSYESIFDEARLGAAVAAGGDVNGDGLADILGGEPDNAMSDGATHLFYGGGAVGVGWGTGRLTREATGAAPVAPGGVSDSAEGFTVVVPGAHHVRGRARARLEVEVAPLGEAFDGAGLLLGSWTDLGTAGTELSLAVSGLEEGIGYHWRARVATAPTGGTGQRAGAWRWGGVSGRAEGAHLFTGGAQPTVYADRDDDGYGDLGTSFVSRTLSSPDGYVTDATDCDDAHTAVNPGATEACNGVDDDCDGATDEAGALGGDSYFVDTDEDGWGSGVEAFACAPVDGYALTGGDCDDADAAVNPGADELCNDVDDDCDGVIDPGTAEDASFWYRDNDADGYGVSRRSVLACEAPPGMVSNTSDCNDANAAVNPGADEVCNDVDDDCDGVVDPATASDASLWYRDRDGDGYGQPRRPAVSCELPPGHSALSTDCDDARAAVYPGAPERCNSLDDDCDGSADEAGDSSQPAWYLDADMDGYGAGSPTYACAAPVSQVSVSGDCDDSLRWVYPGAPEVCDDTPNNCDTLASWDPSDEDGLVSLYALDGSTVTDWTASFAAGTPTSVAAFTLPAEGTMVFCDGTHYARMSASATGSLSLIGLHGPGSVTISAADSGRVLDVSGAGVVLGASGLRLLDGAAGGGNGGGVRVSAGTLLLDECVVESGSATLGGGIYQSGGTLGLDGTSVVSNTATSGGGVYVNAGTFSLADTEVSSNTATDGAGLYLRSGTFTVDGAHLLDNVASGTGGGLRAGARVTVTNSVIDGNSAGQGGGVYFSPASATLQLTDTEVTTNSATTLGGGVYNAGTGTVACTGTAGLVGGFLANGAGTGGGGVYLANTGGRLQASVCDFGDTAPTENSPNDIRFGTNTYNKGNDQTFTCTGGTCP